MPVTPPRTLTELFLGFLSIGARSFGGVLPWAHRVMVEERRWLAPADFAETIGLCQFLPGPNIGNASIVLGKRWFGLRGALVAFLGLVALPFVWVLALGALYADYAAIPMVRAVVIGVGAAGAGLFIGTAIKLGRPLARKPAALAAGRRLLPRGRRSAASRCSDVLPVARLARDRRLEERMALTLLELALYFGLLSRHRRRRHARGDARDAAHRGRREGMDERPRSSSSSSPWRRQRPGPNVLIASLIGWKVAGLAGAVVALLAVCGPAAVIAWWVADLWDRFKDSPWRLAIQRAIAPIVVALILAGGYVIATPDGTPDWRLWLIAAASAGTMLATRLNPLWMIAGGALLGAVLLT